jgi:hypothetical protein
MIERGDDVVRLMALLHEGLHQLVIGPRRHCKTTVCQAALARVASDGVYTVEIDLFTVANIAWFAQLIVERAMANRSAFRRAAHSAAKGVVVAAETMSAAVTMRAQAELGSDIELAFKPAAGRSDPMRYFEHALRLCQRICEADGKHLVLFIDEFQEIAASRHLYGDPGEVTNLMQAVLQSSPSVTCVFAGSVEHMMKGLLAAQHRAYYQWGAWFTLAPIPAPVWRAGIDQRFRDAGVDVSSSSAVDHLVAHGDGHPRTTVLLAQHAYVFAVTSPTRCLDDLRPVIALDLAMKAESGALEVTVAQIRDLGRYALDIAFHIASGDPPYKAAEPWAVQRSIEALKQKGIVERRGSVGRGGWTITDPLLRRYLVSINE